MRLRHIEAFYAIRKAGSINAAARLLNISQPALSKTIQHAETVIGFKLFERVRRRLVPTAEAELLFAEAEKIYRGIEELRRLASNLQRGAVSNLRVGFLPSLGIGLAPRAITTLRQANPQLSFDIRTLNYDEIVTKLLSLEIDIGLAYDIHRKAGIRSTTLGEARLVYVQQRTAAPRARPERMTLEAIDPERLVGLEIDSPVGSMLCDAFTAQGLAYAPAIQVHTYSVAAAFASEGVGCAVVDQFTAHAWRHSLDVIPLEPPLSFSVVALTPELATPSQTLQHFMTVLRQGCLELA
ncbi:LysR family transcriptional regulator [Geminicoccaceae bacterium 1502E]|nr:LysR family transcriptional regulator [Geminicoccaceae bacterium 1502E]